MPFSSLFFLFFFLPVTLLLYQLGGHRLRNCTLLLASLLFYAWGGLVALPILLWIILGNFLLGLLLENLRSVWKRQATLALGIAANLYPVGYYKYADFLLVNLNNLFPNLHASFHVPNKSHVPLGISFIAFHAISYLIDVFSGRTVGQRNPFQLGLYLSFFPKILSGPIQRYSEAVPQLCHRHVTLEGFSLGVERFIIGFGKKLLLANTLAEIADPIFQAPAVDLSVGIAWLGCICYTLQIYFDFSGYTDMAIGLGLMFGFRLPENFNYPYLAQSVQEFWQRWHITLSQWFRDYLYIPLGGNRLGNLRTYCNLCAVFLLCGLWHGASWNFIVWGLMHGFCLILERWRLGSLLTFLPKIVRHAYLLLFVMVSWIFFREDNLGESLHYLGAMLGVGTLPQANPWVLIKMDSQVAVVIAFSCLFAFPLIPLMTDYFVRYTGDRIIHKDLLISILGGIKVFNLSFLFLLALMEMASGTYNPFIYFRF